MPSRTKGVTLLGWTQVAFAIVPLSLTAALLCCSQKSSGGGSGEDAGAEYVSEYCAIVTQCCPGGGSTSTASESCNALGNAAFTGTIDTDAAAACLQSLQAAQKNGTLCTPALSATLSADVLGGTTSACSAVFASGSNNIPPGGSCEQDTDCTKAPGGGAVCWVLESLDDAGVDGGYDGGNASEPEPSVCVQTVLGEGDAGPCIGTYGPSGSTYVDPVSNPPTTGAILCDPDGGLTCSSNTLKCVPRASVGQPCVFDTDCVAAAYCEQGGVSTGDAGVGNDGGFPENDAGFPENECTPRLADGTDCTNAQTGCLLTSMCDPNTYLCTALLADGQVCMVDEQCLGGFCPDGTCSSNPNLGLSALCGIGS